MKATRFPVDYEQIIERLHAYNPTTYARTRNHLKGNVSYLSPYITHGVITLPMVETHLKESFGPSKIKKYVFELAWREYFYNIWQSKAAAIFDDFQTIDEATVDGIPQAVLEGGTGLHAIDEQLNLLVTAGYMHNHARMWVASLVCNFGNTSWQAGARWFFYHLLDGDLASNTLSWQWVSGRFNGRRYRFNQQNINKYSAQRQHGTFLDAPYPHLPDISLPDNFGTAVTPILTSQPPLDIRPKADDTNTIFVYHPWMLNPQWREHQNGRRILLLEPSFFKRYPMSEKRIDFIKQLAENIDNMEIYWQEFASLKELYPTAQFHSVYHPSVEHWKIEFDPLPKMFPTVKGFYKSFFQFWNRCVKIKKEYR